MGTQENTSRERFITASSDGRAVIVLTRKQLTRKAKDWPAQQHHRHPKQFWPSTILKGAFDKLARSRNISVTTHVLMAEVTVADGTERPGLFTVQMNGSGGRRTESRYQKRIGMGDDARARLKELMRLVRSDRHPETHIRLFFTTIT